MLRWGEAYREALRDARRVWLDGQWVQDVTRHPGLRGAVDTIADMYDLQHEPDNRELMTVALSQEQHVSRAYVPPRSRNDLVACRQLIEFRATRCGGMMGRPPDYMALVLLGVLGVREQLTRLRPDLAAGVERYFLHCRDNDLCLATAFTDPQIDRSKPSHVGETLRLVREDADGIVVSGVKTVATLAPQADEFLVLTSPTHGMAPEQALYFAVPAAVEGLTLVCRDSMSDPRLAADRPLGSRFDEVDAWAVFHDVRVPWDRVFLLGDVDSATGAFPAVLALAHYHILIRQSIKARLLAGLCYAIAETIQTWQFPQVQTQIAECVRYAEILRSCVIASEELGVLTRDGRFLPGATQVQVGLAHAVEFYPRMLQIVRELSGQSILMAPGSATFDDDFLGPLVRRYFRGADVSADDKRRLFKLAWDVSCDSFAGRQALFENFNAGGSPVRLACVIARTYDRGEAVEMVRRLAGIEAGADDPAV